MKHVKEFKESRKGLGLLFIFLFQMASAVSAGVSQSGSMTLSGNLNELVSISIKANKEASLEMLHSKKEISLGSVFEISNTVDGYVVKARSENDGRFLTRDGKESIPYDLKYGEGAVFSLKKTNQTLSERNSEDSLVPSENYISISLRQLPQNFSSRNAFQDFITFTIESR